MDKLKVQMQAARRAKENQAQRKARNKPVSAPTDSEKDVVLFRTDPLGRAWPVKAPSQPQEPRGGRRKPKAVRHTLTHTALKCYYSELKPLKMHCLK